MSSLIITLQQLKSWISESKTDDFLLMLQEITSEIAKGIMQTGGSVQQFVEYIDGDGSNTIILRKNNIYSITEINDDAGRDFLPSTIIDSANYTFDEIGEIKLTGSIANFSKSKSNIKVVGKAGLARFEIIEGINDKIDFVETFSGIDYQCQAIVPPGVYDTNDLSAAIAAAMDLASNNNLLVWSKRQDANLLADNPIYSIAYGNGVYVAVGTDGPNRIRISSDMINFRSINLYFEDYFHIYVVKFINGEFIAAGVRPLGYINAIIKSSDGINWTEINLPATMSGNQIEDVIYADGQYIFVNSVYDVSGEWQIARTPDLITFTDVSISPKVPGSSIAYGNGIFVIVSNVSSWGIDKVAYSSDGVNWIGNSSINATSIIFQDGYFFAVSSTDIYKSSDAITWLSIYNTTTLAMQRIASSNGIIIVSGLPNAGNTLTSIYSKNKGASWNNYSDANSDVTEASGSILDNLLFDGRNFVGAINANATYASDLKSLILGDKFTCEYNESIQKFIISCFSDIKILFKTGIAKENSIKEICNFDDSDLQGKTFYSNEVTGIPKDIVLACQQIALALHAMSKEGGGLQMIKQKQMPAAGGGSGTIEYYGDKLPAIALMILKRYRKLGL